jgi:hypothetical protein
MADISELANTVVMVLFGGLLGAVGRLVAAVMQAVPATTVDAKRRSGESLWSFTRRVARDQADAGVEAVTLGPRSVPLALLALYGLIGVIAATLVLSPIRLDWVVLLISAVVSAVVTDAIFRWARRQGGVAAASVDPAEPRPPAAV